MSKTHSPNHLHTAPFQYAEKRVIKCADMIDSDDIAPENNIIASALNRVAPFSRFPLRHTTEQHKDARYNVRCGFDGQLRGLIVVILRDKAQSDIWVLEDTGKPVSKKGQFGVSQRPQRMTEGDRRDEGGARLEM